MACGTPAERAYAEARAQGLPEKIEDPTALARVAAIIAASQRREHADGEQAGAA